MPAMVCKPNSLSLSANPSHSDITCSIKREIGHLCHDERKGHGGAKPGERQTTGATSSAAADPSRSLQRELNRLISGLVQLSQVPGDVTENFGLGTNASTIMPWNTNLNGMNTINYTPRQTMNEFSFLT